MATLTLNIPKYPRTSNMSNMPESEAHAIVEKAISIATYYVPYHLRRSVEHHKMQGLPKHFLIPPQQPPELYRLVASICTQMAEENSDFFATLPENMNFHVNNAKNIYISLCKTVFADKVINWGRVLSIFALAATLAEYFTIKGQLSIVTKIPQWLGEVVETLLCDWIIEQGGWEQVENKMSPKPETSKWSRVIAYGGVVAAAGFLLLRNGKIL